MARDHWPLRLVKTQRSLQVALGLFWILDAALQFQPYMFGKGFVNNFILANASGQPAPIAWFITNVGHFISPDVAVWNTFFALIQLFIGVGLLFRPTVRSALATSFVWAAGVWVLGEGLGMIFTGTASALTGAPGSVLIYGLLGLMAWPRRPRAQAQAQALAHAEAEGSSEASTDGAESRRRRRSELVGVASSAAGRGIGGVVTPLAVWSGFWILAAVLFLLPANRTQSSISSAITGMAPGSPASYAHFLTSVGNSLSSTGTLTAWLLAIASLVIGPWAPCGAPAQCPVPLRRRRGGRRACESRARAGWAVSSPVRAPTPTRVPWWSSWPWPWCRPPSPHRPRSPRSSPCCAGSRA